MSATNVAEKALALTAEASAIMDRADSEGDRDLTPREVRLCREKLALADRLLVRAEQAG